MRARCAPDTHLELQRLSETTGSHERPRAAPCNGPCAWLAGAGMRLAELLNILPGKPLGKAVGEVGNGSRYIG